MTRVEFIRELDGLLSALPDKERLDILADYTEHFLIGINNGKSEQEIAEALGGPKAIAREMMAGFRIHQAESNRSVKNLGRAIFATVSLGFFNLCIVLGPFIGLIGVLFALYVTSFALLISPIAVWVDPGMPYSQQELIFNISVSLCAFGLGLMLAVGMVKLSKWFYRLFLRYLQFNLRLIRGK